MTNSMIDCACVIHGDKYNWQYVEKLYSMVQRYMSSDVRFHVFTERDRPVPEHMIKHELTEWPGVSGPKKSWWYKMQVFDPGRISGQVLYLDLDVIIVDQIAWISRLDPMYFWAIKDWKYLWRPEWQGINSSVMYWNTKQFEHVWQEFQKQDINEIVTKYRGDQDFISAVIQNDRRQFFTDGEILSWRWQIKDGGLDIRTRLPKRPGAGSTMPPGTKILVFHGNPKPHKIDDAIVQQYWHQVT